EGANLNDRVLVELEEWEDPQLNPEGQITEVIGPADDPNLDTLAVIKAYELPLEFPPEPVNEAQQTTIDKNLYQQRADLRDKFIFTIDPDTARDFDDAISLEKTSNGDWQIGVHIADVSHFVTPGSALDKEASKRGTSVYLPDKVIPMLPEQLSNGLCSLKEGEERLAFSAIITVDDKAEVKQAEFTPSVISSNKRLTYEQALDILEPPEGQAEPDSSFSAELVDKVRNAHRLAQKMRDRRARSGALMMDLPDVKFVIGDDGRIEDVKSVSYDISHQLIEELMLLANEEVCRYLDKRGIVQIHRIHAEPDEESLGEIQEMLRQSGIHAGDLTDQKNLADALRQIKDLPAAHAWYTSILRSLKRAEYSIEPIGHYGLAKDYYAHFTSPIRRYPDLVTHRLLKAVLAGEKVTYAKSQLEEIAEHSSAREQVATQAEREINDLKLFRFFQEQIESGNLRTYNAVVVDVRNMGAFIDLPEIGAGGLMHVSDLTDDFYDYDEKRNELRGRRTGRRIAMGERLPVTVVKVDENKRFLDFAPA
ncbi:MAG: VacB/RNase II family 3'-5' exoribonuclease, partial [Lentisphaeria bacterium]